jgi:hypothetical protein
MIKIIRKGKKTKKCKCDKCGCVFLTDAEEWIKSLFSGEEFVKCPCCDKIIYL